MAAEDIELDNLKLEFYIAVGVFGGAIAVLIGAIIGLYVWVSSLSRSLNRKQEDPYEVILRRTLRIPTNKPMLGEELSKRYTMTPPNSNENSLTRNPATRKSTTERQKSYIGELNERISSQGTSSNGYYGSESDYYAKTSHKADQYFVGENKSNRFPLSY